MIPRRATPGLIDALSRQVAVALIGPRQVGKTTLALAIGAERGALYLDLENPDDRARLTNPRLFFESFADRLIILDEIHRMPALFETLRGVIDDGRRRDMGKGRFLVLGSASLDLLRQTGETLAGRIAYAELGPFSVLEIGDDPAAANRLWVRGGFPESYLAATDRESLAWRRDLTRTYLERDVPMFGPRIPAETMRRLWTMLAHRQGAPVNAAELARALETSSQSVGRYIDLLCDLLLLRRLAPYHANLGKRLVKTPKLYIRDSGLVHALLGVETLDQLLGHPVVGASWEGFVIETILTVLPWRTEAFFYRTAAGAEMDLVLEHRDGTRWAIEIKRGQTAKPGRGFHQACADIAPARSFLVHAGDARYPLSETAEAIGLRDLCGELEQVG